MIKTVFEEFKAIIEQLNCRKELVESFLLVDCAFIGQASDPKSRVSADWIRSLQLVNSDLWYYHRCSCHQICPD
ncbi:MAG: hypothetical protein ACE5I5_08705 [Candidatus Heimdallarchaeota archaeon]